MEKYPEFVYIQSSAQMYKDLKENDPELYERVRESIASGSWEAIGGMWVDNAIFRRELDSASRSKKPLYAWEQNPADGCEAQLQVVSPKL